MGAAAECRVPTRSEDTLITRAAPPKGAPGVAGLGGALNPYPRKPMLISLFFPVGPTRPGPRGTVGQQTGEGGQTSGQAAPISSVVQIGTRVERGSPSTDCSSCEVPIDGVIRSIQALQYLTTLEMKTRPELRPSTGRLAHCARPDGASLAVKAKRSEK